jgi:germination protein M
MLHWKSTRLAILFIIIALLTAGCIFGPEQTEQIDPPPLATGSKMDMQNTAPVATTEAENSLNATLYFYDENYNVTPMTLGLPKVEGVAQEALNFMVKGGPGEALLPSGFSAILPEGTTVRGINILPEDKTAIVDFSKEFLNYKASEELDLLQAVTWTLTEFPTIKQVKFRVAGRDLDVMPVANTPVDRPLSRKAGINLEARDNVNIGQTMAVTLYFQGTNATGDYTYYVPVTRLVPRSDDIAKATIEELILGPKQGSSLVTSILPTTELIQVAITGDTITANFNQDLLGFGSDQASEEAIQSIVLSVTENLGMNKVQIMVDGDSKVVTGEKTLEKPVNRPEKINKFKF